MHLVPYALELMFFIVFCVTAWTSLQKYLSYKISVSVKEEKMKEKEYPSVSICPFYAYKEDLEDFLFNNKSSSLVDIERLVKSNIWKRNETFYFVSYPSEKDPGFECMTTPDSYDFVKPCSFPFYYEKSMIIEIPRKKVFICCMNKNSK